MAMDPAVNFELADVLSHIAEQLLVAHDRAQRRGRLVMEFDECEVEFTVKVTTGAQGGIKVWVLEAGANAALEHHNRIRLKFKPIPGEPIGAE